MTLPSYSITITDLDGTPHTITDDVRELETITELSDSADSFSFEILNESDTHSYIEKGCAIEIKTGMGTTISKIVGYITEVVKTLDSDTLPTMSVSGEAEEIRLNHIYFSGRFYDLEVSDLIHTIMGSMDPTTGKTCYQLTGLTNSSSLLDATPYTISEATYTWKSLGAAIKELAELVGYEWMIQPFMTWTFLMFFDPTASVVVATIVDADLEGAPVISDIGDIVNRAVVIGGYEQVADKTGSTQTGTTTITDSSANEQAFVPTEDYLSSVLVYTELVTDSISDITMSIQGDSAAAPDGVTVSNGQQTVKVADIVDSGYTEFRFKSHVTLTPTDTYWIVLKGTTSDGVDVGVAAGTLDYETRYPVRVAIMANDEESQARYANADGMPGIYMQVFRDEKIEDPQIAEVKASEMLVPTAKKTANLTVRDDSIKAGDVVQLTLSEVGIAINKKMKVLSSTQTLGEVFIYNELDMEEL